MLRLKKIKALTLSVLITICIVGGLAILTVDSPFKYRADEIGKIATLLTPNNLQVVELSPNKNQLTWKDSSNGTTGYIVERTPNMGYDFKIITPIALPTKTISYIDTNIINNQRYYYRIKAVKGSEISKYSNISSPTRQEPIDLLLGKGDFEKSSITAFFQNKKQFGSFFYAKGEYVNDFKSPIPQKDEIADGWMRRTPGNKNLDPISDNIISYISKDTGLSRTNSQYFGITNLNTADMDTTINKTGIYNNKLMASVGINDSLPDALHIGDTAIFQIDKVQLTGYENMPAGSTVSYNLDCYQTNKLYGPIIAEEQLVPIPLKPGTQTVKTEFTIKSTNDQIPTTLTCGINLQLKGTTGTIAKPGITIDGAHIYIKRSGETDLTTWQVPAPKKRSITTQEVNFGSTSPTNYYLLASNYDIANLPIDLYSANAMLRNLNPNIKIYSYVSANITDSRFHLSEFINPEKTNNYWESTLLSDNFIGFTEASQHPEWFYKYDTDTTKNMVCNNYNVFPENTITDPTNPAYNPDTNPIDPRITDNKDKDNNGNLLPYVHGAANTKYTYEYLTKMSNPEFQKTWSDKVIRQIRTFGYDGVFIDVMQPVNVEFKCWDTVAKQKLPIKQTLMHSPSDVQSFAQGVMPKLFNAGISVIENGEGRHYDTWPGRSFLDPFWDPNSTIGDDDTLECIGSNLPCFPFIKKDSSNNDIYKTNTPQTTTEVFFQEAAFVTPEWNRLPNKYNLTRWLDTLRDLDNAEIYNQKITAMKLPEIYLKKMYVQFHGKNISDRTIVKNGISTFYKGSPYGGIDGWGQFGLASYMIAQNQYTSFGIERNDINSKDESITGKGRPKAEYLDQVTEKLAKDPLYDQSAYLGKPLEPRKIFDNNKSYSKDDTSLIKGQKTLQFRNFENGIAVANGSGQDATNTNLDKQFTIPKLMVDEQGNRITAGTQVVIQANTGRFFYNTPTAELSMITNPPSIDGVYQYPPTIKMYPTNIASKQTDAIHFTVDGGPIQIFTENYLVQPGKHSIRFYAVNTKGVYGQATIKNFVAKPEVVMVDLTITNNPKKEGDTYLQSVSVKLSPTSIADNNVSYTNYWLDNSQVIRYTKEITIPVGTHTLLYNGVSSNGTVGPSTTKQFTIKLILTTPAPVITPPASIITPPPAPIVIPPLSQRISLTGFNYKSYSTSNDVIKIENTGNIDINTTGWQLKTNKKQSYKLPNYNLIPGAEVTIHAGRAPKLRCRTKYIRYKNAQGKTRYKRTKICPARPAGHIYMGRWSKFFNRKHGSFNLKTSSGENILTKSW